VRFPRVYHCRTCTRISFSDAAQLLPDAVGIALICFCRSMITAKSFAVRNGYEVQADREFMALGLSNIASGLSSGFPIAGRGFAYRNKRPHRGPITGERLDRGGGHGGGSCAVYRSARVYSECFPWRSAVLAGVSLFDLQALRRIWSISRAEFLLSVGATLGVATIGVVPGIALASAERNVFTGACVQPVRCDTGTGSRCGWFNGHQ
jgi:hypothetical protein